MNAATVILLVLIAAAAATAAIVVGSNASLAIPAAAVAVGAAAFLLLGALDRVAWRSAGHGVPPRSSTTRLRTALAAGKHGRRELLAYLDSIERGGFGLSTPVLSMEELNRLLEEPPEEFRRYIDARVRDLERRT